jgi:hypothetical protein
VDTEADGDHLRFSQNRRFAIGLFDLLRPMPHNLGLVRMAQFRHLQKTAPTEPAAAHWAIPPTRQRSIDVTHILRLAATIAVSAAMFAACDRGARKKARGGGRERDVFTAGYETNAMNVRTAALWKNGDKVHLGQGGARTEANSVFVSGADVYVAGFEETAPNTSVAMFWHNGAPRYISKGHRNDVANSVFVQDGDIYIAGVESDSATLWVNGAAQSLSNLMSEALSVFVSDGDVYVSGWEESIPGKQCAMLWVNGDAQRLSDGGKEDAARSVHVSGGTVYVAGYEEVNNVTMATLWKNGSPSQVGQNGAKSYAQCVQVAGGKVYVVLNENGYAKVSTNGSKQFISDKSSYVYSVCVSGNNVHAAGSQGGIAMAWKNKTPQRLGATKSRGAAAGSIARSIFVP